LTCISTVNLIICIILYDNLIIQLHNKLVKYLTIISLFLISIKRIITSIIHGKVIFSLWQHTFIMVIMDGCYAHGIAITLYLNFNSLYKTFYFFFLLESILINILILKLFINKVCGNLSLYVIIPNIGLDKILF